MFDVKRLSEMEPGMKAVVKEVGVRGSMRRRFFDIGLVNDTPVECVGKSPLGDPKAFMIRSAVIAIRNDDAADIFVAVLEENS